MNFSRPTSTPRSGAQPRVTAALIASKYEGRSGPLPDAIVSSSDAPPSPAGAGAPADARIVGSRSTCRTGVSITRPFAVDSRLARRDLRDDQRHVERRLVGEQAVRALAVLAEALAVIGGDDDQRGTRLRGEAIEQRPERRVRPRHFAEVGIGRKPAANSAGGA